ncbi:MAG: MBL fold metallo-hydrolase [Candidatus Schekmanbacteria bacterium]|nr:MAG: MBL fold metallo-hydrolase [Candidatus Schekmanbacteria bacterium]
MYMQIGNLEVELLCAGYFSLDGGASFGIIPKAVWQKVCEADEENRIRVACRSLLIKTEKKNILVDTGMGEKWDDKFIEMYAIDNSSSLSSSLSNLGMKVEDIDIVVNTHLHFDHCGGNTIDNSGEIDPAFPNARYVIQKGEWDWALNPDERSAGSYLDENYQPLMQNFGMVDLVEGNFKICDEVELIITEGHTKYHQSVLVSAGEERVFFPGDLVPTSMHVHLPWIMAYDLFPYDSIQTRKKIFKRAINENWIIALEHDPVYEFGRIRIEKGKFIFVPEER